MDKLRICDRERAADAEEHSGMSDRRYPTVFFWVTAGFALCFLTLAQSYPAGGKSTSELVSPSMLRVNLQGLGKRLKKKSLAAYPFREDGMMFLNGEPNRLRAKFDGDQLADDVLYGERQIIVYPIAAFRKLYSKAEQLKEFDKRVLMLRKAIETHKSDPKEIPLLPSIDACQVIRSKVKFLDFRSGSGVRFVSRYATDVSPTTGRNIFYTFQGITQDQKYWVSVFYPVRATFKGTSDDRIATVRLNSLRAEQFSPNLATLDRMVTSIEIQTEK